MEKSVKNQSYLWILGIDVSKESIDVCIIREEDGQLFENKFHNNTSGFKHLKMLCKQMQCECDNRIKLFCISRLLSRNRKVRDGPLY